MIQANLKVRKMQKLKFDEWMKRKGLTYKTIFERGTSSRLDLDEMIQSLGLLPPDDLSEFDALVLENQPNPKVVSQPKEQVASSRAKSTRSTGRNSKSRTTRKKTNIKDTTK